MNVKRQVHKIITMAANDWTPKKYHSPPYTSPLLLYDILGAALAKIPVAIIPVRIG